VKLSRIAQAAAFSCVGASVFAQTATTDQPQRQERIEVTGSSIKRVQTEGALPVQIIGREELARTGVSTVEQLIETISTNGNGFDNLAATADVVAGANRGNNGVSAANLRSQGSNATLILLNGRRVAAHGLNGGTVDLKQIPLAAVERVEVLKDGASAIYGTDAIGGVINFILRKDYKGVEVSATYDGTQDGGGNVYRGSVLGGFGDLSRDGWNVMGSVMVNGNSQLRGSQRDFVNTFQPSRGLSVDTRGTPYATVFPGTAGFRTILSSRNATGVLTNNLSPFLPGSTTVRASGGINPLDLPGGAGCNAVDGMQPYGDVLWSVPTAAFACAWDTGRAAVLQQPVDTTSATLRGVFKLNDTMTVSAEMLRSMTKSKKVFSNNQLTSTSGLWGADGPVLYPSTGSSYNQVFNSIAAVFPTIAENRGQPIAFRWRCIACGPREIETEAETSRYLLALEGSLGSWDYRTGAWKATSESESELGGGYYFTSPLATLIKSGTLNPFLAPGQSQTDAATQGLAAASAKGTVLYGGKYTVSAFDFSASGPIFKLGAGDVMLAVGAEKRTERFTLDGNITPASVRVFNAPFDGQNDLRGVKRDINAVFTEVAVPVTKSLELTAALRRDDYSGFGATTNPKLSARFNPVSSFLLRGSYSEGFRVPTFNQQLFGVTIAPYSGRDLVDPQRCPALVVSSTNPACAAINPDIVNGGKPDVGPETSKSSTIGIVFEPLVGLSMSADYWEIQRKDQITQLGLSTLVRNAALFPEVFIRDAAGNLVAIDQRWVNAGETRTSGVDINARYRTKGFGGSLTFSLDGTLLNSRKYRLLPNQPFGKNEVGEFSRSGDLPAKWKHTVSATYGRGSWSTTLSHRYVSSYVDGLLPGLAAAADDAARLAIAPNWKKDVKAYSVFNLSASYTGIKNLRLSGGIKNLFNTDPPFTAGAYDADLGAGSSWEPRVADPRGRSFWVTGTYTF
jgi:iron complex outermembrane recepter protein